MNPYLAALRCRNIADYHNTAITPYPASPPRYCARCQCRLRHDNHAPTCDPCTTILRPAFIQARVDRPSYRALTACPVCGCPKKPTSARCRTCSNKLRHSGKVTT